MASEPRYQARRFRERGQQRVGNWRHHRGANRKGSRSGWIGASNTRHADWLRRRATASAAPGQSPSRRQTAAAPRAASPDVVVVNSAPAASSSPPRGQRRQRITVVGGMRRSISSCAGRRLPAGLGQDVRSERRTYAVGFEMTPELANQRGERAPIARLPTSRRAHKSARSRDPSSVTQQHPGIRAVSKRERLMRQRDSERPPLPSRRRRLLRLLERSARR
jgi:hypothetical protein